MSYYPDGGYRNYMGVARFSYCYEHLVWGRSDKLLGSHSYTVKKLEVDLTQKRSSSCSLDSSRSRQWLSSFCHFVIACLCQKGVELSLYFMEIFMHCWLTFGQFYASLRAIWNFEYTNTVTLHCGKSGRWYRSCN